MERRKFLQNIGLGGMAVPFFSCITPGVMTQNVQADRSLIPPRLQTGNTIGIISPAGAIYESQSYEIAVESMQALGLKVKLGEFVKARHGHLAGTDEQRTRELNKMFEDPEVDAIICLRGGSGAARILDMINYESIKRRISIVKC